MPSADRLISSAQRIEKDGAQASARQPKGAIAFFVRIAEARVRRTQLSAETLRFLSSALPNRHDLGSAGAERLVLLLHLDQMLATHRSAEVAQEQENGRLRPPEIRQADLASRYVDEGGIGRWLPYFDRNHD